KHNVSSLPLDPLWIPFSAVKVAEEFLYFTLKLMMDDWQYERPSYQYFLGDIINIEATVKQYFHVPLRVYVDNCVATLSPDVSSNPRYAFIDNHGCLLDARITGSDSKFMARSAENKLQFQLEAFRFQGADSGLLYITCHLKATSTAYAIDSEHRACSFISGWKEASGADAACGTCESGGFGAAPGGSSGGVGGGASSGMWGTGGGSQANPGGRKIRDVSQKETVFEWEGDVTLGPISIGEKVLS
ncbi:zona pellucida sperm-binding protein 3-like, partial [Plectropomus leopardus]